MSSASELLRMLEPAVRPDGVTAPMRAPTQPIESRSFDSFLDQANQMNLEQAEPTDEKQASLKTMSPLSHINQISNQSLRELIASQHTQTNLSEK